MSASLLTFYILPFILCRPLNVTQIETFAFKLISDLFALKWMSNIRYNHILWYYCLWSLIWSLGIRSTRWLFLITSNVETSLFVTSICQSYQKNRDPLVIWIIQSWTIVFPPCARTLEVRWDVGGGPQCVWMLSAFKNGKIETGSRFSAIEQFIGGRWKNR